MDKNLTLSIDEALAERARVLDELWATSTGHSGGQRIRREDAYEDRVK